MNRASGYLQPSDKKVSEKPRITRNHAEIVRKNVVPKPLYPTLPMTSTGPSQDAGKATLDLVMATLASHIRHGPSHVGAPKVHSTGAKASTEECGHKQISHNKFRRFQIQGFHIELSGFWLSAKFGYVNVCKCKTTRTTCGSFHENKTSFTTMTIVTAYMLHI